MKKIETSQLARNIASGPIVSATTASLMAVSYPFYIGRLGYRTYGIWIALSVIISMAQLGNLGMSQALVKRVAENFTGRQFEEIGRFYTSAVAAIWLVAVVLFCGLYLMKAQLLSLLGLSRVDAARYASLATGVFALSVTTFTVEIMTAILSGIGRIDLYNYTQLTIQGTAVITSVVLLVAGHGIEGLLCGQGLGYAAGLIFSLLLIKNKLPVWPLRAGFFSVAHLRMLLGQGSLLFTSWGLSLLFHPVIKIALARSGHFSELPIYEIAVNLSMRVRNLFESGQRALMPEASRLASAGSSPGMRIKPLIQSAVKGLLVAATPVYCILFAFAGPLTQLWLRHSFNAMVPSTLRFFLIGTFVSLLGTPYYYVLIGLGRAQYVLWANAWQFCVCIGGVLTILGTGVVGRSVALVAVLATADVAMAVSTCLLVLFTKRELSRYEEPSSLAEAVAA